MNKENICTALRINRNIHFNKSINENLFLYKDKKSGSDFIGKVLSNSNIENEINILLNLHGSPYIINMVHLDYVGRRKIMIMPFYPFGDLLSACKKNLGLSQIRRVCIQVLQGLNFIHSKSIMHRDIKPANIILTNNSFYFDIKIIDFGLATLYNEKSPPRNQVGTPVYFSPEVTNRYPQSFSSDIWSFGVMIYAITSLTTPFKLLKSEKPTPHYDILSVKYDHPNYLKSPFLVDFLKSIFQLHPKQRPTTHQCLNHKWLS